MASELVLAFQENISSYYKDSLIKMSVPCVAAAIKNKVNKVSACGKKEADLEDVLISLQTGMTMPPVEQCLSWVISFVREKAVIKTG